MLDDMTNKVHKFFVFFIGFRVTRPLSLNLIIA